MHGPAYEGDPYAPRPRSEMVVYIPQQYRERRFFSRLQRCAESEERSLSAVVVRACEEFMARHDTPEAIKT